MILSSSVLSLPRPLCRDALWRERGAVSDRARCVVRDGLPTCHSNAKTRCFGYNCAPSGIFKPEERLRASGARDAGFGDGRVARTSVPWVAREYLADAGTNATRVYRAALEASNSFSSSRSKKNLLGETRLRENPVRPKRKKAFVEPRELAHDDESQTLPNRSSFRVCKRQ